MKSYPPLPEWGSSQDQEESEVPSDEDANMLNSSLPGVNSDEDEGVEASTVRPRSAETSLKRPRTPEMYVESADEEELISRAAKAAKDNAQDSGSSAPPKPSRVLAPTPLSMAPPIRAKRARVASAAWNLAGEIDLDDER